MQGPRQDATITAQDAAPGTASNPKALSYDRQSIPRLDGATLTPAQFFQHYQQPGRPVVIPGLLTAEPAWDLDYLMQKMGDRRFPLRFYGRNYGQQDKRQWTRTGSGVESRSMAFSQYAQLLQNGEALANDIYLARCTFADTPLGQTPVLAQAEQHLGLTLPATGLNLWVGPGGHTSALHYDPMDGTLMQLHGSKRVLMFPPDQLYNLYPFSVWNHLLHGLKRRAVYSQVHPERPDLEAFPRFKQALPHGYEVVLNPGDILFIPSGWWHEISAMGNGTVTSVNRFWHVLPWARSLRLWSKWRIHLGGVLAAPHIAYNWASAMVSSDREQQLKQLMQRF